MRFEISSPRSTHFLILLGALALAYQPLNWLIQTWTDPSYDSSGGVVAALVLGLMVWSASSPLRAQAARQSLAWSLLIVTALVRLAGQVLAINTLSALTLALDAYALGLLLGLAQRQRALAPVWLSLLFLCSLPLERIAQRVIGYGLQQISAEAACGVLSTVFDQVGCAGVRIVLYGRDVLVDLPCSGSRGLWLLLILYFTLAAVLRPGWRQSLNGFIVTLAAALGANVLRICLLAMGIAFAEATPPLVMISPWHDLIGLFALACGGSMLLLWAGRVKTAPLSDSNPLPSTPKRFKAQSWAWMFLLGAVLINLAPTRPVDVAQASESPTLPLSLNGSRAEIQPLSTVEQAYFQRYGGGAARAVYGELSLLLVSTHAPLRHLHAPDECLSGLGHRVEYLGPSYPKNYEGVPSALYRSTDPQGNQWRVAVSFVSDHGETALSVAEAVWHWLQNPAARWTQVQRVTAWDLPDEQADVWEQAVIRALELPLLQYHQGV